MTANTSPSAIARRRPAGLLLTALALGPAGWIAQLVGDYGLSAYACFGGHGERVTPLLGASEPAVLVAVNVAGFVLAIIGAFIGYRIWRAARDTEETRGRTRFLASCAIFASLGFAGAILFDTAEPLMTRVCWSFGP